MLETTLKDIAARFVDFVRSKDEPWQGVTEFPPEVVRIFADTISAAGFDPHTVVAGTAIGHYRDQDGSRTGETFLINTLCPFKVVTDKGGDYVVATEWLNGAFIMVTDQHHSREELINRLVVEIKRSVPLEPVPLTSEGDLLREYPPDDRLGAPFVDHARDDSVLNIGVVGLHMYCNGWMDRTKTSATHDAIVCRQCHLRVTFPTEVRTYGELRQALAEKANAPV